MQNRTNNKKYFKMEIIELYNNLPTRTDQKNVRHAIIKCCKIKKSTFYSWIERGNIPDEKANTIAMVIINQYIEEKI